MELRALGWLRNLVAGALAVALLAGIFLPVYTDEVGWRFQERAAIDGVDKLYTDQCGPNTLAVPPVFMMPVRYFSAYMNLWFADPLYIRIAGILCALAWLAMVLALVRRIASDREERAVFGICAVGLMALANMPLLLVWSRPEQPLLLTATAALLLALSQPWRRTGDEPVPDTPPKLAWQRSLAILGLAVIALSYHLKGIFLVPLFLGCICLASKGRSALMPRIVVGAALAILTVSALSYWVNRLECPADPILRASYDSHNRATELLHIDSIEGLFRLAVGLVANVDLWAYIEQSLPFEYPMSAWLPNGQIDQSGTGRWGFSILAIWGGVVLVAALGFLRSPKVLSRARVLSDTRVLLALLLLVTVMGWSATQAIRNTYESILMVPLLMLCAVLALSAGKLHERVLPLRNVVAAMIGLAAIVSLAMTAMLWGPSLKQSNRQSGYIAQQPFSLPVFGYSRQKQDILGAARLCGIPEPRQANRVMIDDLTYFAFMQSRLPEHRLGVLGMWRGTITDPLAYLDSRGSDGMIVGCHLLPPDLRARAKSQGKYCCLAPPAW